MNKHERKSWERAIERTRKQLKENQKPKLAQRLAWEIRVMTNLLRAYGGKAETAVGQSGK
jgi:hypothetical protein